MNELGFIDWVLILTVPVLILIWGIVTIKINNDTVRHLNDLYKSSRNFYL
jgi:hypothetical protein